MTTAQRTLFLGYIIVGVTLVAYIPAIQAGFIWDDDHLIWRSETMAAEGYEGLETIWLSKEMPDYYPITWSTLWLEYRLYKADAMGYHVSNVAQQIIAALLLWLVLLKLKIPGAWLAAMIFAVHPVNIASVAWVSERKNTLSIIFYLLSIYLYLKHDDGDRPAWSSWPYCGAVASFILGLLCKTSIVVLPVVLIGCILWRRRKIPLLDLALFVMLPMALLLGGCLSYLKDRVADKQWINDLSLLLGVAGGLLLLGCLWWRRRKPGIRIVFESLPFFFLATAASVASVWFQYNRAIKGTVVRTEDMFSKVATAGAAVWFYIYKALIPLDLSMVYTRWNVKPSTEYPESLFWFAPGLALIALAVWMWSQRRRPWVRPVAFAGVYFVLCLLPVLGFFDIYFMIYSFVADHWQHLAIIGIITLVVGVGAWAIRNRPLAANVAGVGVWLAAAAAILLVVFQRWQDSLGTLGIVLLFGPILAAAAVAAVLLWEKLRQPRNFGAVTATMVVMALAVLTLDKTPVYENEGALWPDVLKRNPGCWIGEYNLGTHISSVRGDSEGGLVHLERAVKIRPQYPPALNNYALALHQLGRSQESLKYFDMAIKAKPYYAEAHFNYGLALEKLNRSDEAMEHFGAARQYKPGYPEVLYSMGVSFQKRGQIEKAAQHFDWALRGKPELNPAYLHLGIALLAVSDKQGGSPQLLKAAERALTEGLRRMPNRAEVALNLGRAMDKQGRTREALALYQRAAQLRGGQYDEAHNNLGAVYGKLKDYPKAIQHFQRALQINPRHAVAWSNLGRVLLMANKPAEAAECFRRSLTINGANVAAHLSLANILIQANKLDDAEKHAQAVLKLIPGQPDALALLQRIRKLRTGAPIQPPTSGPPPGKAGP
jgi:protein O-mannosyl-transferase